MISGVRHLFSGLWPEPAKGNNIILTGTPRSGTTLVCRLLCECDHVIALNEPMDPEMFPDRAGAFSAVDRAFSTFRKSLRAKGTARARVTDGKVTDNAYSETSGERKRVVRREEIRFDKPLGHDFLLAMKHCSEFTLLLPELANRYPVYAFVRNPLALLGSWQSVQIAVSRGQLSKASRLNPDLNTEISARPDLLDRQLFIMDWYFKNYRQLPEDRVIRYEDLMLTNGRLLERITGAGVPGWTLQDRNASLLYDPGRMVILAEALLARSGAWLDHYDRSDMESLLQQYLASR